MAYLSPIQFSNSNVLGTTLAGAILAGDNTLTLTSAAVLGCPSIPSFDLLIDSEFITVNGISGNVCTPLSRGAGGTTPAAHANGAPIYAPITLGMIAAAFARIDQANASGFQSPVFTPSGLYAAVQTTSRIVGAVAPGAGVAWTPTGGPYNVGDIVWDVSNATFYVCLVLGSPGTWLASPSLKLAQTFIAQQKISLAGPDLLLDRTDAAALMAHLVIQRAAGTKYGLGLDASDQFAILNAALNAINLGMTDAGLATLRNALKIPPVAAGTVAPTSYGTVPVKITEVDSTGSAVASTTFSSLPTGFRHLRLTGRVRDTSAGVGLDFYVHQLNGDTGANYDNEHIAISASAAVSGNEALAQTFARNGIVVQGGVANANLYAYFEALWIDYNSTTAEKGCRWEGWAKIGTATNNSFRYVGQSTWRNAAAITSILVKNQGAAVNHKAILVLEGIP